MRWFWAVVGIAFAAVSYLLVKGVVDLDFGWGGGSGGGGAAEKCEEGDVKNCYEMDDKKYVSGEAICSESGKWELGDCVEIGSGGGFDDPIEE